MKKETALAAAFAAAMLLWLAVAAAAWDAHTALHAARETPVSVDDTLVFTVFTDKGIDRYVLATSPEPSIISHQEWPTE